MKRDTPFLPRQTLYGAIIVTAAMIALGSFVDYPLSSALYDASNPFALFFAAYGAIPAPLGCVAAGTLFVCGRSRDRKMAGMLQSIGGMLLLLVGALLVCFLPAVYLPVSPVVLGVVGLALSAGTILLVRRLAKGADRAVINGWPLPSCWPSCASWWWSTSSRCAGAVPACGWWSAIPKPTFSPGGGGGTALKESLLAAGVAADEFKSFPSAHTANAATMLLLGLAPLLQPRLRRYQKALVTFGFVWTAVVALSRILLGAHYLTDTAVGFLIGFLSVYLICGALFRRRNRSG